MPYYALPTRQEPLAAKLLGGKTYWTAPSGDILDLKYLPCEALSLSMGEAAVTIFTATRGLRLCGNSAC
jgi:hypothetical protein